MTRPRLRRRSLIALCLAAAGLLPLAGFGGGAPATRQIVVLTRSAPAGRPLDPAAVGLLRVPVGSAPDGALTGIDDAAFRTPRITLPAGMPLVDELLETPGSAQLDLAPSQRAVGVRVDDATGLPSLLRVGSRVDVLLAGGGAPTLAARAVAVLAAPRRAVDGDGWVVPLRVGAAAARAIAIAQADARDVRLLPLGGGG